VTPVRSELAWLGKLRSVTFLWSRVRGLLTRTEGGQTFESFYSDLYNDDQPGFIAMKEAFVQLKGIAEEQGIELQVVMIPELHDLTDYPFAPEYAKVAGFLADNGIDYIDLTDSFAGYENPTELWVALDDAHPNALAQKMIAEFSLEFLNNGGVVNE